MRSNFSCGYLRGHQSRPKKSSLQRRTVSRCSHLCDTARRRIGHCTAYFGPERVAPAMAAIRQQSRRHHRPSSLVTGQSILLRLAEDGISQPYQGRPTRARLLVVMRISPRAMEEDYMPPSGTGKGKGKSRAVVMYGVGDSPESIGASSSTRVQRKRRRKGFRTKL